MAEQVVIKTIRIPQELAEAINEAARVQERSQNWIILDCLRRGLKEKK